MKRPLGIVVPQRVWISSSRIDFSGGDETELLGLVCQQTSSTNGMVESYHDMPNFSILNYTRHATCRTFISYKDAR